MNGLFNTVSNYNDMNNVDNTGNNIMANGDTTILAAATYKCNASGSNCARLSSHESPIMIVMKGLYGSVECINDLADCILDGESTDGILTCEETGGQPMTLRALSIQNGQRARGAGLNVAFGGIVNVVLCAFSDCRSIGTSSGYGGGAIRAGGSSTTVNVYATLFTGNTAATGNGDDVLEDGGTITIHATCPSPYSAATPIQGKNKDDGLSLEPSLKP